MDGNYGNIKNPDTGDFLVILLLGGAVAAGAVLVFKMMSSEQQKKLLQPVKGAIGQGGNAVANITGTPSQEMVSFMSSWKADAIASATPEKVGNWNAFLADFKRVFGEPSAALATNLQKLFFAS